jgi:hypothetical protein
MSESMLRRLWRIEADRAGASWSWEPGRWGQATRPKAFQGSTDTTKDLVDASNGIGVVLTLFE